MITRITLTKGWIYELNGNSEPLFLYTGESLEKITPQEYNLCVETPVVKRWSKIR